MWHGVFAQDMADSFVARHLMNRSEFFPATPLPSIAVSDPRFRDNGGNDWSGPPEGLTFQRAIRALESYGHHAEALLAGARQRAALATTITFPQQIDPFTSKPDPGDCYGPALLSLLEYLALSTGIAVRAESATLLWSSVPLADTPPADFTFAQQLGANVFQLQGFANGTFAGSRNGAAVFSGAGAIRVVTDFEGAVTGVVGASAATEEVQLLLPAAGAPLKMTVAPNEEWAVDSGGGAPTLIRKVPFVAPF